MRFGKEIYLSIFMKVKNLGKTKTKRTLQSFSAELLNYNAIKGNRKV